MLDNLFFKEMVCLMTWQVILRSYCPLLVYTLNPILALLLYRVIYKAYIVWSIYLVTNVTTTLAQLLHSQKVFALLRQNLLKKLWRYNMTLSVPPPTHLLNTHRALWKLIRTCLTMSQTVNLLWSNNTIINILLFPGPIIRMVNNGSRESRDV